MICARVGHRHELVQRGRVQREAERHLAGVAPAAPAPPCRGCRPRSRSACRCAGRRCRGSAPAPGPAAATRRASRSGRSGRCVAWSSSSRYHAPSRIERERPGTWRAAGPSPARGAPPPPAARERLGREAVEVAHHAVVRQDRGAASDGKSTARNQLYSSSPVWPGSPRAAPGPRATRSPSDGARRPRRPAAPAAKCAHAAAPGRSPARRVPHAVGAVKS